MAVAMAVAMATPLVTAMALAMDMATAPAGRSRAAKSRRLTLRIGAVAAALAGITWRLIIGAIPVTDFLERASQGARHEAPAPTLQGWLGEL
jgi:hypothetical protein